MPDPYAMGNHPGLILTSTTVLLSLCLSTRTSIPSSRQGFVQAELCLGCTLSATFVLCTFAKSTELPCRSTLGTRSSYGMPAPPMAQQQGFLAR